MKLMKATEIHQQRKRPANRKCGDERHTSGTVIHWDERASDIYRRVAISCYECGQKSFINTLTVTRPEWKGRCSACARNHSSAKTSDEHLDTGSIIHWGESGWRKHRRLYFVTCGDCGIKRSVTDRPPVNDRSTYTGYCYTCAARMRAVLVLTGDEVHSSGTIIYWSERDPSNRNFRFAITCYQCRLKSFAWGTVIRGTNWPGLCSACRGRGAMRKYTEDEELASGSIIHWGRRDPNNSRRVSVTCGKCKRTRLAMMPAAHGVGSDRYTGHCADCHRINLRSVFARIRLGRELQFAPQVKRGRGRTPKPKETKQAEVADTLRRIKETVLEMKSVGRQRSEVTANLVAAMLHIGGVTGGDTMMRQVNKCGLKLTWPQLRDAIWDDSKIIL